MNNTRKTILQLSLKYGVIGAALNLVVVLILYFSGKHPLLFPFFLDPRILIFLIFIYFVIRDYKENFNQGYLHFWQGIILGVVTYTTIGLLGSLFIFTFSRLNPEFLESYISGAMNGMELAKEELLNGPQKVRMTIEEYNRHLTALQETSSATLAADYFLKSLFLGFLIPLLYSVLFRKTE